VVTQAQEAIRAQGDIGVMETFVEELEAGVNAYYESLGKRADVEAQLLTD
jgi:hypothetical protein